MTPIAYKIKKLMKKRYLHKQATVLSLKNKGKLGTHAGIINFGKKQFLYNPDNPKKSFDVYIDKKS